MKPDFDKAEHLARELRLQQNGSGLALKVSEMVFDKPIIIDTFENYASITNTTLSSLTLDGLLVDGYTIHKNGVYIILFSCHSGYNERLNWTLAHEVGHIYCGHTSDNQIEEVEAHWFAAELLAPEIIIREIAKNRSKVNRRLDVYDIQDIFFISYEAASKRINSLNRKCTWSIYLEEKTIDKYRTSIERYGYVPSQAHKLF